MHGLLRTFIQEPTIFSSSLYRRPRIKDDPAGRFRFWKKLMARGNRNRGKVGAAGSFIPTRVDVSQPETDTYEHRLLAKRRPERERAEAAANLQALPRPLKPPARRTTT